MYFMIRKKKIFRTQPVRSQFVVKGWKGLGGLVSVYVLSLGDPRVLTGDLIYDFLGPKFVI